MFIGIYFGIYVFVTIGLYHILIRVLEKRFGVWPWIGFLLLGITCLVLSLTTNTQTTSMWWGYNAFINLWSVKEMFEQQKRSQA